MNSQSQTHHHELDSVMGTTTRIPRLLSADGFPEWKYWIENYIKMKDFKIWRSIIKNLVRITTTVAGQVVDKVVENYTDEDFKKVEEQERALATLTMALSPDIAQGFRECTSAKALWEALIEVVKFICVASWACILYPDWACPSVII